MLKKGTLAADVAEILSLTSVNHDKAICKYGPATIRHVTFSFWIAMGLSFNEIMSRTGHLSEQLVCKFYNRTVLNNDIMSCLFDDDHAAGESSDEEF